jgi:hypothetical protein
MKDVQLELIKAADPHTWLALLDGPDRRHALPAAIGAVTTLLDRHFEGRLTQEAFAEVVGRVLDEESARYAASGFLRRKWVDVGTEDGIRNATLRFERRLADWEEDVRARAGCDASDASLRELARHMRDRFIRVSEEWKRSESEFRKPALQLYKRLLDMSEEPLPAHVSEWAAELDARIGAIVVEGLLERRKVFLEQRGIQEWTSEVGLVAEALPVEIRIRTRSSDEGPPEREAFALRDTVMTLLHNGLYRRIRPVSETMNRQFESLIDRADELKDMVAVNLGAGQEVETGDREPLIRSGLIRAAQRLQELTENYRVRLAGVVDKAAQDIDRYAGLLETAADTGIFDEITTLNQELLVRQQAATWRNRFLAAWSRLLDAVLVHFRHARQVFRERILPVRQFLGYVDAVETPVARTRAADYLAETDRRLDELPLIYRTLFRFAPVRDPRYLKGRDSMIEGVRESFARWKTGAYSNAVLVGEQGSGKTSVIDELLRTVWADIRPCRILIPHTLWTEDDLLRQLRAGLDMPDADSLDDVADRLAGAPSKVILLEGLQNLYLRHMDGFDAMERFQLLLAQTGTRHFWFLTCTRYAWNYLDDMMQLSGSFTHVLDTDAMTAADIRSAIMTRHRVSGYRAVFTPSDRVKRSRAYRKLVDDEEARQRHLESAFFDDLAEWADGNITIAMLFWLRSIRDVDTDTFTILPFSADLVAIGDAFHLDDLFALAAVLQHGDLRIEELALNQNRPVSDCRMTLTRLKSRRILIETEGWFRLNAVLLRPVTVLLKTRNILH